MGCEIGWTSGGVERSVDQVIRRALEWAGDLPGTVELRAVCADVVRVCTASIVRMDGPNLVVKVGEIAEALSKASAIQVAIGTHDGRFQFESRCIDAVGDLVEGMIQIRCPERITTVDRRRSERRRFARTTKVSLRMADGKGGEVEHATLLNLSADGLACLVDSAALGSGAIEAQLQVRFQLDGVDRGFELDASVAGVTEGGTHNSVVVGLEFLQNDLQDSELDRLRSVLATGCVADAGAQEVRA